MSSVASASAPEVSTVDCLKIKSQDVGWNYGYLADPNNLDVVKCKRCKKEMRGGVFRLKQHVAGVGNSVTKCLDASTKEEKEACNNALQAIKDKKKAKKVADEEVRNEVDIGEEGEQSTAVDDDILVLGGGSTPTRKLGPMDKYANPIDPLTNSSTRAAQANRQQNITIGNTLLKERLWKVKQYLARWMYHSSMFLIPSIFYVTIATILCCLYLRL